MINTSPPSPIRMVSLEEVQPVPISQHTVAVDEGLSFQLVSKAVSGSPDVFAAVLKMGPNQLHPPHAHPNIGELYFVLDGAAEIAVDDTVRWCTAGTAIYTPAGRFHSIKTGEGPVSVLAVFPEGDWERIEKIFPGSASEAGGDE